MIDLKYRGVTQQHWQRLNGLSIRSFVRVKERHSCISIIFIISKETKFVNCHLILCIEVKILPTLKHYSSSIYQRLLLKYVKLRSTSLKRIKIRQPAIYK